MPELASNNQKCEKEEEAHEALIAAMMNEERVHAVSRNTRERQASSETFETKQYSYNQHVLACDACKSIGKTAIHLRK